MGNIKLKIPKSGYSIEMLRLQTEIMIIWLPIRLSAIRHLPAGTATTAAVAWCPAASSP
jgi:hypothetical protein